MDAVAEPLKISEESKSEIAYIAKLSSKFGFHFVPLSWNCGNQKTAIQERARNARYKLMSETCKNWGISLLLTAHHFDDMLVTLKLSCNDRILIEDKQIHRQYSFELTPSRPSSTDLI